MTVSQKASLSLLISIFLFAIFTVVSFMGLFDLVETRFYNPSISKNVSRELAQDTQVIQVFIRELDERFSEILQNEAVKRSFLPNQSAEDIFERSRLFGTLMESLGGLQSIRFIDAAGRRIHYSTLETDIFYQDRLSVSYRNYDEDTEVFPYSEISVSNQDSTKLTLDSQQDRILFSLPFYDSYNVFRGTAVFSLSVRAVSDRLLSEGLIKYGEDVSIISDIASGVVIGMPRTDKEALVSAIIVVWNEGITALTPLDSENGELSFALISAKTDQGIFTGRVVDESLFAFPFAMKLILLISFFLTTYLIIFLLFNIHQDSMTVIQNRVKRLQINLFEEYYERKGNMDWSRWSRELEQRREEVKKELKQGIKIKPRDGVDVDTLIDKSWNEMTAVMNAQGQPQLSANIDEEKLSSIVNKVLAAAGNLPAATKTIAAPQSSQKTKSAVETENPVVNKVSRDMPNDGALNGGEELVEDLEEVEMLDDADEPSEVEDLEEAASADEPDEAAENLEELEELPENVEDLEVLEELDDDNSTAEVPEELETLVGDGEALETLEAAVSSDEASEIEELAESEELEELEELSAAAPESVSLAEIVEELAESENADDLEVVVEDLEALEDLDDPDISVSYGDSVEELASMNAAPEEKKQLLSEEDIAKLASEIEFADTYETEDDIDFSLEVYSPFGNVISDSHEPDENKKKTESDPDGKT